MIEDVHFPIFGNGEKYDDEFKFKFASSIFDQELSITVELLDEDGWTSIDQPSNKQAIIFKWFKEEQLNIKKLMSSSIFEYYKAQLPELRNALGKEADKNAPVISSENEIWQLLKFPDVLITGDYLSELCFTFDTAWDREHGLTLIVINGEVSRIE